MDLLVKKRLDLFILLSLLFTCGCNTKNENDGNSPHHTNPPDKTFVLDEPEEAQPTIDRTTGKMAAGIQKKKLSKDFFKLKKIGESNQEVHILESSSEVIIDGNYAIELEDLGSFSRLSIASAYVELNHDFNLEHVDVGFNLWRGLIHKNKDFEDQQASCVVNKSVTVKNAVTVQKNSFLTVNNGAKLILADKDFKAPAGEGLFIASTRRNKEKSDLWRLFNPSLHVHESTLNAPLIQILHDSSLSLQNATLTSKKLVCEKGVLGLNGSSKLKGDFSLSNECYIMVYENSSYQPPIQIGMGNMQIDGTALLSGALSIHSSWSPGPDYEEVSYNKYEKGFQSQREFMLIKANKLEGKARLISQNKAQQELGHKDGGISYFEKFVTRNGKKLALEHNYKNGELKLKIVDNAVAVDASGCLPDIR